MAAGGRFSSVVGFGSLAAILWCCCFSRVVLATEQNATDASGPKHFNYYQLWASEDGETHIAKCRMHGFNYTPYSAAPQWVRSSFGGEPLKLVFTELPVGEAGPLHSPPQVQFVVTLYGSWYVKVTDGTRIEFKKGDVLFQDNTKTSPAKKQPMHYSGTVGNHPCQQMVVQISRPPQVDNPCPFNS